MDVNGGPNHLKNLCDANMIQDVAGQKGDQPLIKQASRYYRKISSMSPGITAPRVEQASYYYMGHFSRYLVPGAKRVQVSNTVEVEIPQVAAGDIKNGASRPRPALSPAPVSRLERRASTPPPPPRPGAWGSACHGAEWRTSSSRAIWGRLGQSGAVSGNLGPSRPISSERRA